MPQIIAKLGQPTISSAGGFYDMYDYELKDGSVVSIASEDDGRILFVTHGDETLFGHTPFENK